MSATIKKKKKKQDKIKRKKKTTRMKPAFSVFFLCN